MLPHRALLVGLLLLGIPAVRVQAFSALVDVAISQYITISALVTPSFSSTDRMCKEAGGVPLADYTLTATSTLHSECLGRYHGPCATYLDGRATSPNYGRRHCHPAVRKLFPDDSPSSFYCAFRYMSGFFDLENLAYNFSGQMYFEPGTVFFSNVWAGDDGSGSSGYGEVGWNQSFPRGKLYTIGVITGGAYGRLDVDPAHNSADKLSSWIPAANYVSLCAVQDHLLNPEPYTTTSYPQPDFVQGWKELMWVQKNWWVPFLLVAFTIVAFLLALLIYCTVTARKMPVGTPIHPLTQRERVGGLYIREGVDDMDDLEH